MPLFSKPCAEITFSNKQTKSKEGRREGERERRKLQKTKPIIRGLLASLWLSGCKSHLGPLLNCDPTRTSTEANTLYLPISYPEHGLMRKSLPGAKPVPSSFNFSFSPPVLYWVDERVAT